IGNRAVAQLGSAVGEQEIAAAAHAHQLSAFDIHDVLVFVGDGLGTHLAALAGRLGRAAVGPDAGQHVIGAAGHETPSGAFALRASGSSAASAIDSTPSRSSNGI